METNKKIRAAVVGLGNIGIAALEALGAADDFEIAGVVRRSVASSNPALTYPVVANIEDLGHVDVAILCTPSRSIAATASGILAKGIHTIDSFDIHSEIVSLKKTLDPIAKAHGATAVISSGWDPGSDSIIRALMLVMAPKGVTYTNFGPGMSMGHSVAVKAVPGVKDALSVTVPLGTGIHRRMVYVELHDGADFDEVVRLIKQDAYFIHDETHVKQVSSVNEIKDVGHGVQMVRKGVSSAAHNQLFEYSMRINNPALTAQFMVSAARAAMKQAAGAYTVIELPLINFLPGQPDQLIAELV